MTERRYGTINDWNIKKSYFRTYFLCITTLNTKTNGGSEHIRLIRGGFNGKNSLTLSFSAMARHCVRFVPLCSNLRVTLSQKSKQKTTKTIK